jgi:hypothetical protein
MVPNTTHMLGQGGIPDLKAAFVSTLNPLLHFFLAKTHMLVSFCPVKLDFLRYLCDTFAMRIASQRQVYGVLAFWVAIVDAMRFVSQAASQVLVCEGLRFAKVVEDLNKFFMRFFTYCIMGTVQEVQEEDHNYINEYGPGAWQGASFSTC